MYMYQGPTEKYFARIGKLIDTTFQKIESGLKSLFYYMYSDASPYGEQAKSSAIFNSLWLEIAFSIIAFAIWDIVIIIGWARDPCLSSSYCCPAFFGSPYIVALTKKIIRANLIPNLIALIRGQKNG